MAGPFFSPSSYRDARMPSMRDLTPLLDRNVALRHLWHLFMDGTLSLEQALIAMVSHLAEQNERLTGEWLGRTLTAPANPFIKAGQMVAYCNRCFRTVAVGGACGCKAHSPDHVVGPPDPAPPDSAS
jgi:hypothetical protein